MIPFAKRAMSATERRPRKFEVEDDGARVGCVDALDRSIEVPPALACARASSMENLTSPPSWLARSMN